MSLISANQNVARPAEIPHTVRLHLIYAGHNDDDGQLLLSVVLQVGAAVVLHDYQRGAGVPHVAGAPPERRRSGQNGQAAVGVAVSLLDCQVLFGGAAVGPQVGGELTSEEECN